jgi:hypothetical protein
VLLPGFQKGRDINRPLKEKGREQFWPKKGYVFTICVVKNGQNCTPFRVNKMFSLRFWCPLASKDAGCVASCFFAAQI